MASESVFLVQINASKLIIHSYVYFDQTLATQFSYLEKLVTSMEVLNTVIIDNDFVTSLTKQFYCMSRISSLRNLILPKQTQKTLLSSASGYSLPRTQSTLTTVLS